MNIIKSFLNYILPTNETDEKWVDSLWSDSVMTKRKTFLKTPIPPKSWETYLSEFQEKDGELVRELWQQLIQSYGPLPAPLACPRNAYLNCPTPDDDGFSLYWDKEDHHLEIEILPDHSIEWFYRNRNTKKLDSNYETNNLTSLKQYIDLIRF